LKNSQTCTFKELQCNILTKPEIENFSNLHLQGTAMQHPDPNLKLKIFQTCTFKELQCNVLTKPAIEKFSNLHLQGTAMQHPDQT
jgi:hypothetical protein